MSIAQLDMRLLQSFLAVAEELHTQTPTSRLVVLPRVGHQLNMEAADQFNSVVRDFLHRQEQWA